MDTRHQQGLFTVATSNGTPKPDKRQVSPGSSGVPTEAITGRDKNGYEHKPEPETITTGRPANSDWSCRHTLPSIIQRSLVDAHRDNHHQTIEHPSLALLCTDKLNRSSREPTLHRNTRIVHSTALDSGICRPRRRKHSPSRMVAPASCAHRPQLSR